MSEPTPPRIRYSMVIEWSDEDSAFIATVPELVGCRTHGRTYAEAVKNGQEVLEMWVEGDTNGGAHLPPPNKFVYRWWSDDGTLGEPEAESEEVGELAQQRG